MGIPVLENYSIDFFSMDTRTDRQIILWRFCKYSTQRFFSR